MASAKKAADIKKAHLFGVDVSSPRIEYKEVQEHIHDVISQIAPMDSVERYEGMGADVYQAEGYFENAHHLILAGKEFKIKAKKFVIAVGNRPVDPQIPGLLETGFYNNETIFKAPKKPSNLIVIGAGPIGVEMAQAHARLGCDVTIITDSTFLPKSDPEFSNIVQKSLLQDGVQIIENATVEKVESGHLIYHFGDDTTQEKIRYNSIFVAAGRQPNLANLGLSKAGIEYSPQGILVDDTLRTNHKHIYAIGDCAYHPTKGQPQFTHIASYHASLVIKNMLFRLPVKLDYKTLPYVTYSDPELAWTGLSEIEAIAKYGDKLNILRWPYHENDRARAERRLDGMTKILVYKGRVVGGGIVGPHAGDMLPTLILAIQKKIKVSELAGMIVPYPTYAEVIKRASGDYFKNKLFSAFTKKLVRYLFDF